ncbi:hypothetical protein OG895_02105 [Streptomyces sp. NBC_00201]|uniref:hypothetical protein n=1 Tax=unclassified Streptomyces TaxID=2593676 RepID=UPI0022599916|nr:hypothetical protein [Streptomyces sp. NBC_00201]MCX5244050.1 hypothetical protein [Streptomyces sp. NBC_00201]MCX5290216.1 hypothetical protein [Streptomyces sp. NBC_00183]
MSREVNVGALCAQGSNARRAYLRSVTDTVNYSGLLDWPRTSTSLRSPGVRGAERINGVRRSP